MAGFHICDFASSLKCVWPQSQHGDAFTDTQGHTKCGEEFERPDVCRFPAEFKQDDTASLS